MVKLVSRVITNFAKGGKIIMDRKVKKLSKEFLKLDDEQKKEMLSFLTEDQEESEVEEEVDEVEEVEDDEEEEQEGKQTEVLGISKEDLETILSQFADKFVTKDDFDKASKKAKPFGKKTKPPKVDKQDEIKLDDLLAKVNSQFV